jgi:hypothetical protein
MGRRLRSVAARPALGSMPTEAGVAAAIAGSIPEASAVIDWRCGPGAVGGDEGVVMASKDNLHRETLRAALRVIQTAETLEQARIQLARMLNVFDKLEAKGIKGDAAVAEAEDRLMITQAPKTSAADERPVRRRDSSGAGST